MREVEAKSRKTNCGIGQKLPYLHVQDCWRDIVTLTTVHYAVSCPLFERCIVYVWICDISGTDCSICFKFGHELENTIKVTLQFHLPIFKFKIIAN